MFELCVRYHCVVYSRIGLWLICCMLKCIVIGLWLIFYMLRCIVNHRVWYSSMCGSAVIIVLAVLNWIVHDVYKHMICHRRLQLGSCQRYMSTRHSIWRINYYITLETGKYDDGICIRRDTWYMIARIWL